MRRNHKIFSLFTIVFIGLIVLSAILMIVTGNLKDIGAAKTIKADVKSLHLFNTEINFINPETDDLLFVAKGNYIKIITDPLTLYDADMDTKLGYASDEFHLIAQDSHVIITNNGERSVELVGKFQLLGDKYDIYIGEELVAIAEFNAFNTYGTITSANGEIMADYTSKILFNDFTIQITRESIFSDEEIALIFASYYSDQKFDSRSRSSHSSHSSD